MHLKKLYIKIKIYKIFIIDKVFIINNNLFNYISELLTRIYCNNRFFEKIHVVVFKNLMQLFSIKNRQIFFVFQ